MKHEKKCQPVNVSTWWKKNDDYKGLSLAQLLINEKQGDHLSVKSNMSNTECLFWSINTEFIKNVLYIQFIKKS